MVERGAAPRGAGQPGDTMRHDSGRARALLFVVDLTTREQFLAAFAPYATATSLLVVTHRAELPETGSRMRFRLTLSDGAVMLSGEALVTGNRGTGRRGVVRLEPTQLDDDSRACHEALVERARGASAGDRMDEALDKLPICYVLEEAQASGEIDAPEPPAGEPVRAPRETLPVIADDVIDEEPDAADEPALHTRRATLETLIVPRLRSATPQLVALAAAAAILFIVFLRARSSESTGRAAEPPSPTTAAAPLAIDAPHQATEPDLPDPDPAAAADPDPDPGAAADPDPDPDTDPGAVPAPHATSPSRPHKDRPPTGQVTVQLESSPPGAVFRVNGKSVGRGPTSIRLPAGATANVYANFDGLVWQRRVTVATDSPTMRLRAVLGE